MNREDLDWHFAQFKAEIVKWLLCTAALQTIVIIATTVALIRFLG